MKKVYLVIAVIALFVGVFSCNKKDTASNTDTILTGKVTILVDETILPVIEDQVMVFESQYNAKIKLVGKSETEIVKLLSEGKNDLAILTRELTKGEGYFFVKKKINPKVTTFATDGIAFISSKSDADIKIDLKDVVAFMKGESNKFSGLVFDNGNSSTVKYFKDLAKVDKLPTKNIYSFNTNNEVIKFVADNPGTIGVVGVNWLTQPMPDFEETVDRVSVLDVKANNGTFAKPTQDLIASGIYPATREIKMLNYQGYSGLGMGFASFVAGEIGQRIILKSGLVPVRMPGRNIIIRKEIEKKNK
ncbi:substrate-binding domain-containing protein [Flavobacterium amniphilum]|uniref:PstS family phosphate ABC transporter substrate-binding protein n=1 Tax=Flavobacterium amniphilum TaxID=1834035 RepID=UPI00202AACF9|nr:substrate-binding domain-containing protein [Flavobacterium amniphilum]MCL9806701.1 substrate-binding domain-containing protein [Flavobacterium amniphilum]